LRTRPFLSAAFKEANNPKKAIIGIAKYQDSMNLKKQLFINTP
jgi:hypothetical protein